MVSHEREKELITITIEGASGAGLKSLIGPAEGWSDCVMRKVELEAFGHSPEHAHPWPHINYILREKEPYFLMEKKSQLKKVQSPTFHPIGNISL